MKAKKKFEMPQIEAIRFDEKDVITQVSSPFATDNIYDVNSLKGYFNINV
ncbi:MAG: hypothetical protein ACI4MS_07100 [Candidatus Coproplasma sp.]